MENETETETETEIKVCFMCGGSFSQPADEKPNDQCVKCRRIRHRDWYDSLGR